MSYLVSYSKWKMFEQSSSSDQDEEVIAYFMEQIKAEEAILDLLSRKSELVYLDASDLKQLAKNLNVEESLLTDLVSEKISNEEFVRKIAEKLAAELPQEVSAPMDSQVSSTASSSPISMSKNLEAFLSMLKRAEGTDKVSDPYRVTFGYQTTIQDFSDHPYLTGEWKGSKLSDSQCKGAGQRPGCITTAAGAYQITSTTWRQLKKKLNLPDFSPASQDKAALELIREKGAIELIEAGKVEQAIDRVKKVWASLPGAGYGQGERSLASLKDAYSESGGEFAASA